MKKTIHAFSALAFPSDSPVTVTLHGIPAGTISELAWRMSDADGTPTLTSIVSRDSQLLRSQTPHYGAISPLSHAIPHDGSPLELTFRISSQTTLGRIVGTLALTQE